MKIQIRHRYLVFPANHLAAKKRLSFFKGDRSLYTLDISLDNIAPRFEAFVDVSRFMGEELTLSLSPELPLSYRETDEIDLDGLYEEPYRPLVHFTTKSGWINDPNGLIFLNGTYHMFYQHNPCDIVWSNMHWGHATSTDLLHWREEPIALYPDETGAMYSGCAIVDEQNRTGLGEGKTPPTLLFYTATSPFSQYLAYSTDSLKTIKKYRPALIGHIVDENRDPSVAFVEEWGAYALALFLSGNEYGIFRSENLLEWTLIQRLHFPEERECPDLFVMTSKQGERKWVLMGANDRYLIGDMTSEGFCPDGEPKRLHYGKHAYAGQTFSGMTDGRTVRMHWVRAAMRTPRFTGQMGIPTELTLSRQGGELVLLTNPIRELSSLFITNESFAPAVSPDAPFRHPLTEGAYLIRLRAEDEVYAKLALSVFGKTLEIDTSRQTLTFLRHEMPLTLSSGTTELTLLIDRLSLELFLDGGRHFATFMDEGTVSDYNLPYLELRADQKLPPLSLEIHALSPIR